MTQVETKVMTLDMMVTCVIATTTSYWYCHVPHNVSLTRDKFFI